MSHSSQCPHPSSLELDSFDFSPLDRHSVYDSVRDVLDHTLHFQTHLFYNRHVDQLVLSALYGFCKVHKLDKVGVKRMVWVGVTCCRESTMEGTGTWPSAVCHTHTSTPVVSPAILAPAVHSPDGPSALSLRCPSVRSLTSTSDSPRQRSPSSARSTWSKATLPCYPRDRATSSPSTTSALYPA